MNRRSLTGLFLSVFFFGFFGIANTGIPNGEEDNIFVHVNILNGQDDDIDDLSLRAFIYEIGQYPPAKHIEVEDDSNEPATLQVGLHVRQDDYEPVRVVMQNDDIREVRHVWVWTGPE